MCGICALFSGPLKLTPAAHTTLQHAVRTMRYDAVDLVGPIAAGAEQVVVQSDVTEKKLFAPSESMDVLMKWVSARGPDVQKVVELKSRAEGGPSIWLGGAVLHLRGATDRPTPQPELNSTDADNCDALLFNGEVFGGPLFAELKQDECDTTMVWRMLREAADTEFKTSGGSVPHISRAIMTQVLSKIHGPFAFAFYHAASKTLFFGRDKLGRRSLLISLLDQVADSTGSASVANSMCISSVSANVWHHDEEKHSWAELPCVGVFSITIDREGSTSSGVCSDPEATLQAVLDFQAWPKASTSTCSDFGGPRLPEPAKLRRLPVADAAVSGPKSSTVLENALMTLASPTPGTINLLRPEFHFLALLSRAVERRVKLIARSPSPNEARVAVLFSGGVDCTVIALLAHVHLLATANTPEEANEPIDLINVTFQGVKEAWEAESSPDRQAALHSLKELQRLAPTRKWRFVRVNITLNDLEEHRPIIEALARPRNTVMDLNIGAVLYFASRGIGVVGEPVKPDADSDAGRNEQGGTEGARKKKGRRDPKPSHTEPAVRFASSASSSPSPHVSSHFPGSEPTTGDSSATHTMDEGEKGESKTPVERSPPAPFHSKAPVLLLGSGADEQLGGYGRHRTAWRSAILAWEREYRERQVEEFEKQWLAEKEAYIQNNRARLAAEKEAMQRAAERGEEYVVDRTNRPKKMLMPQRGKILASLPPLPDPPAELIEEGNRRVRRSIDRDVRLLWTRNLGRDDRILSHWGKEARHPFLDEDLMSFLWAFGREVEPNSTNGAALSTTSTITQADAAEGGDGNDAGEGDDEPPEDAEQLVDQSALPFMETHYSQAFTPFTEPTQDSRLLELLVKSCVELQGQLDASTRLVTQLLENAEGVSHSSKEALPAGGAELSLLSSSGHTLSLERLANYLLPPGVGDKRLLRTVAQALGLADAGRLVKRAMQFGSRIANRLVAGTVVLHKSIPTASIVHQSLVRPSNTTKSDSSGSGGAGAGQTAPSSSESTSCGQSSPIPSPDDLSSIVAAIGKKQQRRQQQQQQQQRQNP